MGARSELLRGIAIGIVIGAAVTIAVVQLRPGCATAPRAPERQVLPASSNGK